MMKYGCAGECSNTGYLLYLERTLSLLAVVLTTVLIAALSIINALLQLSRVGDRSNKLYNLTFMSSQMQGFKIVKTQFFQLQSFSR